MGQCGPWMSELLPVSRRQAPFSPAEGTRTNGSPSHLQASSPGPPTPTALSECSRTYLYPCLCWCSHRKQRFSRRGKRAPWETSGNDRSHFSVVTLVNRRVTGTEWADGRGAAEYRTVPRQPLSGDAASPPVQQCWDGEALPSVLLAFSASWTLTIPTPPPLWSLPLLTGVLSSSKTLSDLSHTHLYFLHIMLKPKTLWGREAVSVLSSKRPQEGTCPETDFYSFFFIPSTWDSAWYLNVW